MSVPTPAPPAGAAPTFAALGLAAPLLRAVRETGYAAPTPIQAAAIPAVLTGRDLTATAQTGTGKTAAFVLPMLHRLLAAPAPAGPRRVRALVVAPTRELALQIEESVRVYGAHTGLRASAVFGGVGMRPQVEALRRGVDVVVATPGRLLDHLAQRTLDLSAVEILVLDEADRMFDMGFVKDVRRIVAAVPATRQTLLFSATMPPAIQGLSASIQTRPQAVDVGRRTNPAETVDQAVVKVASKAHKPALLLHVLQAEGATSAIAFTRTKHGADRVAKKLAQAGVPSAALHGNRSQGQRQKALAAFKDGTVRVLVATDIAARGIDVDGVSHVVNVDVPAVPEDYIHRIGRTGRAEATGRALTFVTPEEAATLRDIEKTIGRALPVRAYPDFTPPPPAPHVLAPHAPPAHPTPRGHRPEPSPRGGRAGALSASKASPAPKARPEPPAAPRTPEAPASTPHPANGSGRPGGGGSRRGRRGGSGRHRPS